jgi:hypothetical protein
VFLNILTVMLVTFRVFRVMTSCGWAHIYQHSEDLVASMFIVVEKDFVTLISVLKMEALGCCERFTTTHKPPLRYIVDDWNI